MDRKSRIEKILQEKLQPEILLVKNNSYLHQGHLGDDGSGETHFSLEIKAQEFSGVSRIIAHKKIHKLLEGEFLGGLHALEIRVL